MDDAEKEERFLEAASLGTITKALGMGGQKNRDIGEITQANFRDQGF